LVDAAVEIAKEHGKSSNNNKLVISFSLYQRSVRKWVEERFLALMGIPLQFVVLNDAENAAPKRKLDQVKASAIAQGKTIEAFVAQYGSTWKGEEETLKSLSISQKGFEPGVEVEGEIDIEIRLTEDANSVLHRVVKRLDLKKELPSCKDTAS
jgi:hypothetical protein